MQIRVFLFVVGALLCGLGLAQLCVAGVSLILGDGSALHLAHAAMAVIGAGVVCVLFSGGDLSHGITHRDGFAIVGLCWMAAAAAGSLPYMLALKLSAVDALFESVSGFTTTGATILTDIEAVPQSILLWRGLTHWLGGMGIIMLSLAILPLLGAGGMQLYKAEVPGPTKDKLTPRIRDTAVMLWKVYALMTLAETGLLWLAGMSFFDAVNHTFATVATGGFSTRNASIAAFPSPTIQWIVIVFMAAAGMNFVLHFRLLSGRSLRQYTSNAECRAYMSALGLCVLAAAGALGVCGVMPLESLADLERVVRAAAFQVVSICTTTGFITEDYLGWPFLAQGVLLGLMLVGGCAGSTAGGVKFMRVLLLNRMAGQEIFRLLHPYAKRQIRIDGRPVPLDVLQGVTGFALLYVGILGVSTLALSAFQIDLATAFTASLTCLSNVGPGFGGVGPMDNFAHLPGLVKAWLALCMLLGRLELYAVFLLLLPAFWRD